MTLRPIEVKNYLSVLVSYQSKCVIPVRSDLRKEYVQRRVLDKHNPYFTHKVMVSGFIVNTLQWNLEILTEISTNISTSMQ